jgi:hypothetical protein
MFCVEMTVHSPVGIDVLCIHDRPSSSRHKISIPTGRWMFLSTQNINTYWTMDGRVYTKHQYLQDYGRSFLHKTSIPTGRWMAISTQNINTYWTMDGHFYTKHQYLLDDGCPCLHKTVGIDVLCRHERPSSSRY